MNTMDLIRELAEQRADLYQQLTAAQDENARLEHALRAALAEVLTLRGQCAELAGALEWALDEIVYDRPLPPDADSALDALNAWRGEQAQ